MTIESSQKSVAQKAPIKLAQTSWPTTNSFFLSSLVNTSTFLLGHFLAAIEI